MTVAKLLRPQRGIPDESEWGALKEKYQAMFGDDYLAAVARVEKAATAKPKPKSIASLFQLPLRGASAIIEPEGESEETRREPKVGKIKTELLFIERCLDLLTDGSGDGAAGGGKKPGGRLGIVLPEGVFNNPSLQWVRDFVEDRAWLRAVVSLPQDTFVSSGASVKCSILFLQKFTAEEKQRYGATRATARAEIEAKYAPELANERARIAHATAALGSARVPRASAGVPPERTSNAAASLPAHNDGGMDAAGSSLRRDAPTSTRDACAPQTIPAQRKLLLKELADFERATTDKIAAESRALLKQRWDYPIFLYEAEHVGITATGDAAPNELYPNDRQPPGCEKTCLELFREFERDP